ncbi:MAG: hypothetical protein IJC43_00545 [Clostridia bacterium]|nr:hypothetical protein [Clostridia bacterium]
MTVKSNGTKLLRIASILLLLGAAAGTLLGLLTLAGLALWDQIAGGEYATHLPIVMGIFTVMSGLLQGAAGVAGFRAAADPRQAGRCRIWGAVVIVLQVVGTALTMAGGKSFPAETFFPGLLLPALYLYAAQMLRGHAG